MYVAAGTAAFEHLQFFAVNLRGFVACFRVSPLCRVVHSPCHRVGLTQPNGPPSRQVHPLYSWLCIFVHRHVLHIRRQVEFYTACVQTVVQIVGIPKPQIIEEFVQVQTKSVFRSASLNKASTLQCLRSRGHCRNVPALPSGAHHKEHRGRVVNVRIPQFPTSVCLTTCRSRINRGSSADHTTGQVLNRTGDQIVDASILQPQEEILKRRKFSR